MAHIKLVTPSGREYPREWALIYDGKMSFFEALYFIFKMNVWVTFFYPTKKISVYFARLTIPIFWFLLYAVTKGSILIFGVVGFVSLIVSIMAFEKEKGLHGRLTFTWGAALPLLIFISPILSVMIMGSGNKEGLSQPSKWQDYTSFKTTRQATSGRTDYGVKNKL